MIKVSMSGFTAVVAIAISLIVPRPCIAADRDPSEALWQRVIDSTAKEKALFKTVDIAFDVTERWEGDALKADDGVPLNLIERHVRNIQDGRRFRIDFTQKVADQGGIARTTLSQIVAFDGTHSYTRDSEHKNVLLVGRSDPTPRLSPPRFDSILQLFPVEEFELRRRDGRLKLLDASEVRIDDMPMIKVRFQSVATGYIVSAWYSVSEGYLLRRAEDAAKTGQIEGIVKVDEVATVKDDTGHTFFVAARGVRQNLKLGKVGSETIFAVDKSTVKINGDVDPKSFSLKQLENEIVINLDLAATTRASEKEDSQP